jgi:DNA-binding NarL/FixJ family response regulator
MQDRLAAVASGRQILVIDRQALFLAAIARLLREPPLEAVVTVRTRSDHGLRLAMQGGPDLILCDLYARPLSGPAMAVMLARSRARVILLADREDGSGLVDALPCGAAGFFTKDASPDEFQEGLLAVLAGHYVVGKGLAKQALGRLGGARDQIGAAVLDGLSATQRTILVLAGQGQREPAIAQLLGLAESTVRAHFLKVCRLLELQGTPDLLRFSAKSGLSFGEPAERAHARGPRLASPVEVGPGT